MNGRLYRLTPAGGEPNHYTDSYASVRLKVEHPAGLDDLDPGDELELLDGTIVERVA